MPAFPSKSVIFRLRAAPREAIVVRHSATLVAAAAICAAGVFSAWRVTRAENTSEPEAAQVVETKELMKILFEPQYVLLRDNLKTPPEGRQQLRQVYLAAFTMAELHNLLFTRQGQEYMESGEWRAMAAAGRAEAIRVGEAVKAKDYEGMKAGYAALIQSCNACHNRFQEPNALVEVKP